MCNNSHIAILLHVVLLYCLYEQSSAHISFWLILFLQFCLGRLKHKYTKKDSMFDELGTLRKDRDDQQPAE